MKEDEACDTVHRGVVLQHNITTAACRRRQRQNHQGRSDGGISVYIPPKSVYLTNFYVVTGCFLTQDKLLLILKLE